MENKLKDLFKIEVAQKGKNSTVSFGLFALFSFFYGYSLIDYLWVIKTASVFLLFVAVARHRLNLHLLKENHVSDKNWRLLKLLIWANALGWGVILNTASFELRLSGIHFVVVTTLLAGFVGASLVSLSYFKELFIPFLASLLVPQIIIILYFYFSPEKINNLPLIIMYVMYFLYQIKSFRSYRKELIKLFKYQIGLENKNRILKKSQADLLEQSMMLAHASRLGALGEMSATIAHEINNPIAIVSASSKLISKESDKPDFQIGVIHTYTDRIDRSVLRIGKIVKGLRNLSNQSDHMPKEKVSLKDIVEDTAFFCGEVLVSKNIKLDIDDIPEATLDCHPVQISQVVLNLIKNASEVLVDEKNVAEKWINLKFEINDQTVKILVINGGVKITPEMSAKIFAPFFTTKPMGIGTGLGLSISRKIITDHGGDIRIDHSFDHTAFVLELKNNQVSQ